MPEPILSVRDLVTGYGDLEVIHGVTFDIQEGSLVALAGPNGAGKTTLLNALVGVNPAWSGAVMLRGQDTSELPVSKHAHAGLALVPEGRQLFNGLTVRENLELASTAVGRDPASLFDHVLELFPPLRRLLDRPAGNLSGGEQQMCAVGRGLMADPSLLVIDELSLGLAPIIVDRLVDALRTIHREYRVTVLFVEQDVSLALDVATDAIVLSSGQVALSGAAAEIAAASDALEDAFLGVDRSRTPVEASSGSAR